MLEELTEYESFYKMDQKDFERAISAYTDKIVEEDSHLVKYVMSKSVRTDIIARNGTVVDHEVYKPPRKTYAAKPNGRPLKLVVTPKGVFLNIHHAAIAYGVSVCSMRGKLAYSKKSACPDMYMKDNNGELDVNT